MFKAYVLNKSLNYDQLVKRLQIDAKREKRQLIINILQKPWVEQFHPWSKDFTLSGGSKTPSGRSRNLLLTWKQYFNNPATYRAKNQYHSMLIEYPPTVNVDYIQGQAAMGLWEVAEIILLPKGVTQ